MLDAQLREDLSWNLDGPPEPSATSEQPHQVDTGVASSCTQVGNAEGVGVDLADVLDLEGWDCFAQVSVPARGASSIRGFAGNDA